MIRFHDRLVSQFRCRQSMISTIYPLFIQLSGVERFFRSRHFSTFQMRLSSFHITMDVISGMSSGITTTLIGAPPNQFVFFESLHDGIRPPLSGGHPGELELFRLEAGCNRFDRDELVYVAAKYLR